MFDCLDFIVLGYLFQFEKYLETYISLSATGTRAWKSFKRSSPIKPHILMELHRISYRLAIIIYVSISSEASRGAAQGQKCVTVKMTGWGFDPYSRK